MLMILADIDLLPVFSAEVAFLQSNIEWPQMLATNVQKYTIYTHALKL